MKYLYKYPQKDFPYENLVSENAKRGKTEREYQLLDTGIFEDDRYFDCFIEMAKEDDEELLFRVTAYNRGPDPSKLHVGLPQPMIPLFKQIGSTETMSRCSPKKDNADLEKYNRSFPTSGFETHGLGIQRTAPRNHQSGK